MPLDNSGYIASEAIDWNGLTNGLSKTIYDIGNNRAIRKQELDDQFTEMDKQFRQAKVPANQTLGNLFLNITDAGVNRAYELNKALKRGEVSETEYRRIMNNMNDSFKGTINSVATLDTKIADMVKRQGPDGDGSNFEVDLAKITGSLMELQGKTGAIDADGFIKIGKVDPETGKIVDMYDPEVLNKPENVRADKYKLRDNVAKTVKQWQPLEQWKSTYRNGWISIDSIKNKPEYKEGVETLAKSLASKSNQRNLYSILSDNAGVPLTTYQTEEEKNKKIQSQIDQLIATKKSAGTWNEKTGLTEKEISDINNNMVKLVRDSNNVFQPEMTEEQYKKAVEFTKREIELQVETDMKGEAPTVWQPRAASGDGDGKKEKEKNTDLRDTIKSAFVNPNNPKAPIDRKFMADRLTAATAGKVIFIPNPDGIGYKARRAGTKEKYNPVRTARDASSYFFGPGEEGIYNYDEQEEFARQGGKANPVEPTTKDASIDWKNLDKIIQRKGKKLTKGQSGEIGRAIQESIQNNPDKKKWDIYNEVVDDFFSGKLKNEDQGSTEADSYGL